MPRILRGRAGAISKQKFLDDLVNAKGRGAALHRKLVKNKDRNWLLAVVLNAFSKNAAKAQLSDAEQIIINALKRNGYSDTDMADHAALYDRLSAADRNKFFRGKFATLDKQSSYSIADLKVDLPEIEKAILSAPNSTNVDVDAVHARKAHLRDYPMVTSSVMKEYGSSVLRAVAADATPHPHPHVPQYTIKAAKFRCNDETGWDWSGADEPYWIFGSIGAGGFLSTTASRIFPGVDTGETRSFAANEGCIWGQNCLPQNLPDGEIGALVSLWEHDYTDPNLIKESVALWFASIAIIFTTGGPPGWVLAVIAGIGALLAWILQFAGDDHIADQVFVFNRQVLDDVLRKSGQTMDFVRRFTDGDGDYSLTITATRFG